MLSTGCSLRVLRTGCFVQVLVKKPVASVEERSTSPWSNLPVRFILTESVASARSRSQTGPVRRLSDPKRRGKRTLVLRTNWIGVGRRSAHTFELRRLGYRLIARVAVTGKLLLGTFTACITCFMSRRSVLVNFRLGRFSVSGGIIRSRWWYLTNQ